MEVRTPSMSYSVAQVLRGQEPQAIGVAADGHVWFVLPVAPIADTAQASGDDRPYVDGTNTRFRVVEMALGQIVLDIEIDCPVEELWSVDSLGDQILVAWSRADWLPGGGWGHNAWVYSRDGTLQQALSLGDAIEELQVTADGVIWTSHFDEGYFGRWKGSASLVAWDRQGRLLFRPADLGVMDRDDDVFGLNLASLQDTWFICCGSLMHLREGRNAGAWALAGGGSPALAVEGRDVLLAGDWGEKFPVSKAVATILAAMPDDDGSLRLRAEDELSAMLKLQGKGVQWGDERDEASNEFSLCWMKLHAGGNTSVEGDFVLRSRDGEPIVPTNVIGRGGCLFVLAGQTMHEVALADVVAGRCAARRCTWAPASASSLPRPPSAASMGLPIADLFSSRCRPGAVPPIPHGRP